MKVVGIRSDLRMVLDSGPARHTCCGAARIVRRVACRAGIIKPVGPHTLRHAFITAVWTPGCRCGMCKKPPPTPIPAPP